MFAQGPVAPLGVTTEPTPVLPGTVVPLTPVAPVGQVGSVICAVPVLPATRIPGSCASTPVPSGWRTTAIIILRIVCATQTGSPRGKEGCTPVAHVGTGAPRG